MRRPGGIVPSQSGFAVEDGADAARDRTEHPDEHRERDQTEDARVLGHRCRIISGTRAQTLGVPHGRISIIRSPRRGTCPPPPATRGTGGGPVAPPPPYILRRPRPRGRDRCCPSPPRRRPP